MGSTRLFSGFRLTRFAIVGVGLAVLLSCAGAAWCYFAFFQLPPPEAADRSQLLQWMACRDLSDRTPDFRSTLARRLQEEFQNGPNWSAIGELDTETQARFWNNFSLLIEPWLADQWGRYERLSADQRPAFLDSLVKQVSTWQGPGSGASTATKLFSEQAEGWKAKAEPGERERITAFLAAVQVQWLVQKVRQWNSPH